MLQPIFIPAVEFLRRPCQECLFFIYFGCRRVRERKRLPGIFMHTTASQARTPWKPRLLQNWVFLPLDQSLCLGGREAGWRWVSQCPIHLHSQPDRSPVASRAGLEMGVKEPPGPGTSRESLHHWTPVSGAKNKGRAHSFPTVTASASSTGNSLRPQAPC